MPLTPPWWWGCSPRATPRPAPWTNWCGLPSPGGHIVFSLRTDTHRDNGFKEKQEALDAAGLWQLVEVTDTFQPLPKGEPEVLHQVWVYQVS